MVHLARRVQLGESLYPEWRSFPHVANIYTPGYFYVVGGIGKAADASLEGVQWIGRGVTIFFSLAAAGLVAWAVRRHGRSAMIVAACLCVGSGVMLGFGWMTRPDVAADALGFAGFLAAASSAPLWLAVTCAAAGMFCKQTAVVYVAAAAFALWWQDRRRRAAAFPLLAGILVLAMLGLVWLCGERRAFLDVFQEGSTPWRASQWAVILARFAARCGDLGVLSLIGLGWWIAALRRGEVEGVRNAQRWIALLFVSSAAALVGAAKVGSDVNYFLPLRFTAAAALAEAVSTLRRPSVSFGAAIGAGVQTVAFLLWALPLWSALRHHERVDPGKREATVAYEREVNALARLGAARPVLTNCDDLALRIANPFMDAYAFKLHVETGQADATRLREKLDRGEYHVVATLGAVDDPGYLASDFGLPRELVEIVLRRYERTRSGMLIYYRPKSSHSVEAR
jgi:hypothetical protein